MKLINRMILADDHSILRDLLRLQLGRMEPKRFEVVGEANDGPAAVEVCLKVRPDIVLLDLMMPGLNGLEVMRRLQSELPDLQVLIFSASNNERLISEALALGAAGFVGKPRSLQTVLEALAFVAQGGKYFDPMVSHLTPCRARLLNNEGSGNLTAREREVVQLIAESHSTKEIASRLGVSVKTVDKHRTHLMEKLQLHSAVDVTRYAIRTGLVNVC